jgi:hypothetical protein
MARDRLKGTKLIYHYDSLLLASKAVTRNIHNRVCTHKSYRNIETEKEEKDKKKDGGGEAAVKR